MLAMLAMRVSDEQRAREYCVASIFLYMFILFFLYGSYFLEQTLPYNNSFGGIW